MEDEERKAEEAKEYAKKVAEWKVKKRQKKRMEALAEAKESADMEAVLKAACEALIKEKLGEAVKNGEAAKTDDTVVNGEKEGDEEVKGSSEMPELGASGDTNGEVNDQKPTNELEPTVNGSTHDKGKQTESTGIEGKQVNGVSKPQVGGAASDESDIVGEKAAIDGPNGDVPKADTFEVQQPQKQEEVVA